MGDADHFSQSTDRDIFSDEDEIKCRGSEKEAITTTSTQSSSCQPTTLSTKKTPRGKSSRKNNRKQALVTTEYQSTGSGYVNAAEHEAQFCNHVNLYVDYLLVLAVKELVEDGPSWKKAQKESDLSKVDKDAGMNGFENEPVFTATDDSYMDLISEEIHSTLPCNERHFGVDDEEGDREKGLVGLRGRIANKTVEDMSPPLDVSMTERERKFERAAENYMNTSFPENNDVIEDEYDSDEDVLEDDPPSTQPDVSETTGQRHKHHNTGRRKYEFEVDCETGMVFSFEIVEPEEDRSDDEYEVCDECDECDRRDAEFDDVDIESNCIVEFEPDEDSVVFRVIDENDDVEETVYTVVDENGGDTKLAKKTSNFRARSPTKLPRAIREGTESHRRRCYSTGDAERFESLESSSSEFYSHADTIDKILTLPSPPKSSPGSFEVDDSEGDMSSSQEELEGILDLDPPILKSRKNVKLGALQEDEMTDTPDTFDGDMITKESDCFVKYNQESRSDNDQDSDPPKEDERHWQDLLAKHQVKLNELHLDNLYHGEVSYNTNHRSTEENPVVDTRFEGCPESPKHNSQTSDEINSSAIKHTAKFNTKGDEDGDETRKILTQRGGIPLDAGCIDDVKVLFRQKSDADENVFEYVSLQVL